MNFLLFRTPTSEPEIIQAPMIHEGAQAIRMGEDVFIHTKNIVDKTGKLTAAHFHKAIVWKVIPESNSKVEGE